MTVAVPSELDLVEQVVELVAKHCVASGMSEKVARFNLRVALSEALANAIVYGNELDPGKEVRIALRLLDERIQVVVEDQGTGFDPDRVPDPRAPDCLRRPDGRGLFLIKQLVDEIAFNEEGNTICMTLRRA